MNLRTRSLTLIHGTMDRQSGGRLARVAGNITEAAMKQFIWILGMVLSCSLACGAEDSSPLHLGGFVLGEDIAGFTTLLDEDTTRKVRYGEYLGETDIRPGRGFVSGSVAYGTCVRDGSIVRIKLKFADSSVSFFEELLERYREQFGKPDEYKGDPFHTFIAWKWSFTHPVFGHTSLILQHNVMNPDEKTGNAVKLSLTTRMEEERRCHEARVRDGISSDTGYVENPAPADWTLYVPY